MALAFTWCCLPLRRFLIGAALVAVMAPVNARSNSLPFAFLAAPQTDWERDDTPAQFFRLEAGKAPIDPASCCEPLLAAAIFQETNQQRTSLHLSAFLPDEKASDAARLHAKWMADSRVLSHDESSGQGKPITALARLVQQGLRPHASAENIAYNLLPDITPGRLFYTRLMNDRPIYSYQPGGVPLPMHTYDEFARIIVAQWMHSPGHRAHIVDPGYRFLGVGVALSHRRGVPDTIYAAQEFFTPHSPPTPIFNHRDATLLPRP